jgi:hypothetical protein
MEYIKVGDSLKNKAIRHQFSAAYSHDQNGQNERPHRTLFNTVRALLFRSNLPKKYWGEALLSAAYLYNRTPNQAIGYRTPYELKYNKKPNISHIKAWGSLAYKYIAKEQRIKLDKRATPYYLIGYRHNQYKVLNIQNGKTEWIRDIRILEGIYYKDEINSNRLLVDLTPNGDIDQPISDTPISDTPNQPIDQINLESEIEPIEPISGLDLLIEQARDAAIAVNITYTDPEPKSYKQALQSPQKNQWIKAMDDEIADLIALGALELVKRPKNKPVLTGKWVYKQKLNPDHSIDRYKARYIARGFLQTLGIDFNETFANTARLDIVRTLLAIAIARGLYIKQWDFKLAFPNSPIDTEVYIETPEGYRPNGDMVYKVLKALYSLKQSARQWQLYLASLLAKYAIYPIKLDPSVYTGQGITIISHVDDILVFSDDLSKINKLYKSLSDNIDISDLGDASFYLGIEIVRNNDSYIFIHQESFITKLLAKFNKETIRERDNPTISGVKLVKNPNQATPKDIKAYQEQIGSLIYIITCTRPDLAYIIGLLARFMSNPSLEHFKALDHVWGYISKYRSLGILYKGNPNPNPNPDLIPKSTKSTKSTKSIAIPLSIEGESDSDWGGDFDTRRSTTGWIYTLNNSFIAWNSKLQRTVALSSCEAEYMALREAIKQGLYLKNIAKLVPLIDQSVKPIGTLYTDSQSAMELAKNPVHHARSKHIDIQYHFIRENVNNGTISLVYRNTSVLRADGFTKALPTPKFRQIVQNLGLIIKDNLPKA